MPGALLWMVLAHLFDLMTTLGGGHYRLAHGETEHHLVKALATGPTAGKAVERQGWCSGSGAQCLSSHRVISDSQPPKP